MAMSPSAHPVELAPSAHIDDFCRRNLPERDSWPELVFDLPELQYPDRLNAGVELLDRVAETFGEDRPALRGQHGAIWTYGQLRDTSNRIARALADHYGIVPGNRVLLRGPNNPWLVACWFGVLKAGAVAVTTMPMLRARELEAICEVAEISFALSDHRYLEEIEQVPVSGLRVVSFGDDDPSLAGIGAAIAGLPAEYDAIDTAADDVALLAFTSGTTGRPKATMHFHRDLLAIADTFSARVLRPHAEDVFVGTPPIAFTFGLGGAVVFPLRAGASVLLLEVAPPLVLADLIAEHGVTICLTAPTAYKAMIAGGKIGELAGLRRAVSAGEHLPASTWHAVKNATGISVIDGIGSTEMLHVFASAADDEIRPGSTGRAVPGFVVDVLDDEGERAETGVPGRLAVKGPTGCRYLGGYRQEVYVQNGWNLTGDIYIRDAEGYLWSQGRNDDIIVSAGYNIAGYEVEEALLTHSAVLECCVVGAPDAARGTIVSAAVVLREGVVESDELVRELQDHVKREIAPYKYPRRISFVNELPKTTTGKIQRFRLRESYLE